RLYLSCECFGSLLRRQGARGRGAPHEPFDGLEADGANVPRIQRSIAAGSVKNAGPLPGQEERVAQSEIRCMLAPPLRPPACERSFVQPPIELAAPSRRGCGPGRTLPPRRSRGGTPLRASRGSWQ